MTDCMDCKFCKEYRSCDETAVCDYTGCSVKCASRFGECVAYRSKYDEPTWGQRHEYR